MDYTWGNMPNSPYYEYSDDDYLENILGVSPMEYYMMQDVCSQTRERQTKKTASNAA